MSLLGKVIVFGCVSADVTAYKDSFHLSVLLKNPSFLSLCRFCQNLYFAIHFMIMINAYALHHNPHVWEDPEVPNGL